MSLRRLLVTACVALLAAAPALGAPGDIIVSDAGANALLRVDPRSGDRTLVSSRTLGKGTIFGEVWGIVVVPTP